MPELPEVQTTVSGLKKTLPGLKIRDVWCDHKKMIKEPGSFKKFKEELTGRKILGARRRGKNILIDLSGGKTLLVHQKMTGHMLYGKYKKEKKWTAVLRGPLRDDPQNRFLHLVITLSNGKHLVLSDVRKFAKVLLWETAKLDELKDIKNIGPDALDKNLTFKTFKNILYNRKGLIRDLLMKQELISGIGNIYSSEILWEAGIHPFKENQKLKEVELRKIYKAIEKILSESIRLRGDSMVDYRDPYGKKGKYQEFHRAYQREGKKCPKNDGGTIKRVKKAGRSAFFCSVHQKK